MKKLFVILTLLFLVGCSDEKQETTFKFTNDIQKITVIGKGVNAELDKHTIEEDADIKVIEDAMQNAKTASGSQTDEGPKYELEVVYVDGSKESIELWYYTSSNKGRFKTDEMYSLNEKAALALIELFETFK